MAMYDIYIGYNNNEATARGAVFEYNGMNPADALAKFAADYSAMREAHEMGDGKLTEITAFDDEMSASIYPLDNGTYELHLYIDSNDIAITLPATDALMENQNELISVVEAAEILGVHRNRVLQLVNAGQIDGYKVGKTWNIVRSSVEKRAANPPSAGRRW